MKKKKEEDLEAELVREYEHWEHLRDSGGTDPFYDDSGGMNLTRNHIIYAKQQLEERYGADWGRYPAVYFRELPPETKNGYMAEADRIRNRAAEVLDLYLSDADFQYLLCHKDLLDKKEAAAISIENVLGYVSGLAWALKEDDLVTMRRHVSRPEIYQESFASCARQAEKIISGKEKEPSGQAECEQMTLFQFGLGNGQCR